MLPPALARSYAKTKENAKNLAGIHFPTATGSNSAPAKCRAATRATAKKTMAAMDPPCSDVGKLPTLPAEAHSSRLFHTPAPCSRPSPAGSFNPRAAKQPSVPTPSLLRPGACVGVFVRVAIFALVVIVIDGAVNARAG